MSNSNQDFLLIIKKVEESETSNFCELASLLGRNPKTDFAGSNLSHTDLSGCDLSHADLSYADLSHTDLSGADLSHADLSNANLIKCNLEHSNLRYSNLSGCDMENANLKEADLAHADLTNCNLANANLDSVDLSLVDFSLIRPLDSLQKELEVVTKEPQKPDVDLWLLRPASPAIPDRRRRYQRFYQRRHERQVDQRLPRRRNRSRVISLGEKVLKYVPKVIVTREQVLRYAPKGIVTRKSERLGRNVNPLKYFIASNDISPPRTIEVHASNGKVLKFFWDGKGLFSYRYAVENFSRFPLLLRIYNVHKDAIFGGVQERDENKVELT